MCVYTCKRARLLSCRALLRTTQQGFGLSQPRDVFSPSSYLLATFRSEHSPFGIDRTNQLWLITLCSARCSSGNIERYFSRLLPARFTQEALTSYCDVSANYLKHRYNEITLPATSVNIPFGKPTNFSLFRISHRTWRERCNRFIIVHFVISTNY